MKHVLVVLLFLFCLSAKASDFAVESCNNYMHNSSNRSKCLEIIAGKAMSDFAVESCNNYMHNSSNRLKCLEIIAGKVMSDFAVESCNNYMHNSSNRLKCLEIIAGKAMSDSAVESCNNYMHNSSNRLKCLETIGRTVTSVEANKKSSDINSGQQEVKGMAIEFCRKTIAYRYKDDCITIVAPSQFIDAGAFNLCKMQPSYRQIECLSAVVNRKYVPGLIEECLEKSSHRQIECLSKYGSLVDSQEDKSIVITITQNGGYIVQGLPKCKYENFHGLYPEGGGCNFHGCWIAGGGCNFHGCWYPGGFCDFNQCVKKAPQNNICQ